RGTAAAHDRGSRARPPAELRVRGLPGAGDRPVPLRGALEARSHAQLEVAPGERDEVLREARVATALSVEQIVRLEHDGDVVAAAQRFPREREVDVGETVGRRLE